MKKVMFLLIVFFMLSIFYIVLNLHYQENVSFNEMRLNNVVFTLEKIEEKDNFKKLTYDSNEYNLTIYKKKGWIPPKGKPFSKESKNLFNSIEEKNKKYDVLSDYYHHVFVINGNLSHKELDFMFFDYATKIYCVTNKNLNLHPKIEFKMPLAKKPKCNI